MSNKGDTVLQMLPPKKQEITAQLNWWNQFYNNMCPGQTHIMAPLSRLTGKVPWNWTPQCQFALDKVKAVLASNCMNQYVDLDKPITIVCDASNYQLGSCIMQDGMPIAYWSKTLSTAQQNYTTTEK